MVNSQVTSVLSVWSDNKDSYVYQASQAGNWGSPGQVTSPCSNKLTHINARQEDKTSDSYRTAKLADDKQLHLIPNAATTDPHMALGQSEPAPQTL